MIETITLEVDTETAAAYQSAAPEQKRKMQLLIAMWLSEFTERKIPPLNVIMDEIGERARTRGLTEEIVDSLLKDE